MSEQYCILVASSVNRIQKVNRYNMSGGCASRDSRKTHGNNIITILPLKPHKALEVSSAKRLRLANNIFDGFGGYSFDGVNKIVGGGCVC